jgi:hypothetical protein
MRSPLHSTNAYLLRREPKKVFYNLHVKLDRSGMIVLVSHSFNPGGLLIYVSKCLTLELDSCFVAFGMKLENFNELMKSSVSRTPSKTFKAIFYCL